MVLLLVEVEVWNGEGKSGQLNVSGDQGFVPGWVVPPPGSPRPGSGSFRLTCHLEFMSRGPCLPAAARLLTYSLSLLDSLTSLSLSLSPSLLCPSLFLLFCALVWVTRPDWPGGARARPVRLASLAAAAHARRRRPVRLAAAPKAEGISQLPRR